MERTFPTPSASPGPRVLFVGTTGAFSFPTLQALLAAAVPVCGVVVPAQQTARSPAARPETPRSDCRSSPPTALPVIEFPQTPSILTLAAEHGLPVLELESFEDPAFLQRLTEMSPDLITVACFPRRFPRAVLDLPRHGCWNVHPSLLPRHRGPAPLFWAFRDGDTETGVTVHIMDDGIDSGDILLQQAIPIPEGIRGSELERTCAEVGARLLLDAVQRVSAGGSEGVSPLPRRRQQLDLATYESWPTIADLEIPLERSASWAFQFIRGIGDWYPVTITAAGHRLRVRDALGHCPKPDRATLPREIPYRQAGDEVWIRMNPGVLHVRVG